LILPQHVDLDWLRSTHRQHTQDFCSEIKTHFALGTDYYYPQIIYLRASARNISSGNMSVLHSMGSPCV